MPRVPNDLLLLGIAQIAVVIAGFTAVTAALTPPGGSWSPDHRIRQRAIVSTSFNDAFHIRSRQLLFVLGPLACLLFASNAIVFASVALYSVALLVQLSVAVVSFYSVVSAALPRRRT